MSTKFVYQNLVDRLSEPPHSLTKFGPLYGALYWKETWQKVAIMPLDRKAHDLNWKLAHGGLYTADRLVGWGIFLHHSSRNYSTSFLCLPIYAEFVGVDIVIIPQGSPDCPIL